MPRRRSNAHALAQIEDENDKKNEAPTARQGTWVDTVNGVEEIEGDDLQNTSVTKSLLLSW
jgi:hypothetical protein